MRQQRIQRQRPKHAVRDEAFDMITGPTTDAAGEAAEAVIRRIDELLAAASPA